MFNNAGVMWIVEAYVKNAESSIVANRETNYLVFVWVAAALQVEGDILALSQRDGAFEWVETAPCW